MSFAVLSVLTACSPSKGEATLGDCPEGTESDGNGNCEGPSSDDDDTNPDSDPDEDTDPETDTCGIQVDSSAPNSGDGDVSWWTGVTFTLDDNDPTASISVTSQAGSDIPGTSSVVDNEVIWSADTNLEPDTTYSATLDWCGGLQDIQFSTAPTGEPLETDVSGETFALDLGTAEWIKPEGVGSLLGGGIDQSILVGVQEASEDVDFIIAIPDGDTDEQDYCLPTLDFEPTSFEYSPNFRLGPVDMPISMMGYSLTIYEMDISGVFVSDGSGMEDVKLAGAIDLRDIGDALGELTGGMLSDADSACDLIVMFGVSCNPCPDDGEPLCIDVELDDVLATATGSVIEVVEEADTHPECDSSDTEGPSTE